MEERKRTFETMEPEPKRMRPEEILGSPEKLTTRILMTRQEFSKVIGKGGATISHIRNTCGALIKGFDIDPENRLIVISGTLRNILEAFEAISELIHQSYAQSTPTDNFSIQLLLEHTKAGRVVGQKGAMIQTLKLKSGTNQIKMQKDIREISGVQLRVLTIEGQLAAVRRAHFFVLELFTDPSQIASLGSAAGGGGYDAQMQAPPAYSVGAGGGGHSSPLPFAMPGPPLPLNTLTTLGVQAETVRQLSEMKAYLSRQFGLDLSISREGTGGQLVPTISSGPYSAAAVYGGIALPSRAPSHNPDEVSHSFAIPRATVGGIIGKAGQVLQALQTEFGLRIYVEKEEVGGMRTVLLKSPTGVGGVATAAEREAFARCQERIVAMSQDPSILSPALSGGGEGGNGGSN